MAIVNGYGLILLSGAGVVTVLVLVKKCIKRQARRSDLNLVHLPSSAIDKFLDDMRKEKPIRFSSKELKTATNNYSDVLGSGGFGVVYKGSIADGIVAAVKVLSGFSDKQIEEQFMAEVSTTGKIHHFNLVRLYGFCFDKHLKALVYDYMANGSLDKYLFDDNNFIEFEKLHEIAVGTARGIAYLHEECQQRIIHYDIKPGNILLDANFQPKVADFGLAKLHNREKTHITLTVGRGTPGYAAPELWMPFSVTHKCDVYSFGMLLFEIIGRRRNLNINLPKNEEWFPKLVWNYFEKRELDDLMEVTGIEEEDREIAQRMVKVALCCVQYKPESRPLMSVVVKMLEGALEIPIPLNPFQYLLGVSSTDFPSYEIGLSSGSNLDLSVMATGSSNVHVPI